MLLNSSALNTAFLNDRGAVRLQGAMTAEAVGTCALFTGVSLRGSMTAEATGTCRLSVGQRLSGTLAPEAIATLRLAIVQRLAASLTAEAIASCALTTPFPVGSFTANLLAAAAALSAKPVCILFFNFGTGWTFCSDAAWSGLSSWTGGPAINAWVVDWGRLDDVADPSLSESPVLAGDFTVRVHVPDGIDGADTMWTRLNSATNLPEQTVVRLYLWFRDLNPATDPPVRIWEGTIKDWPWIDEQTLSLVLADATERLDKPVGRAATLANFPNCDPDDVGKMEPIIYGSVTGLPCLAINAGPNSPLAFDLTASATVLYYSQTAAGFATNGRVVLGEEEIDYTAKTTETLSGVVFGKLTGLTRGVNGTTAVAHNVGDVLVQALSAYTYLAAGHRMKSVSAVYVEDERGHLVKQPGTSYAVNLSNGSAPDGIQRTTVTFNVVPKIVRQTNQTLSDTIAVSDTVAVADGIGVNDAIGVADTISVTSEALQISDEQVPSGAFPISFAVGAGGAATILTFPAPLGTIIRQTVTIEAELTVVGVSGGQQYGGQLSLPSGPAGGIYILSNDSWLAGISVLLGRQQTTLTMSGGGNTVQLQGQISRTAAGPNQTGTLRVYACKRTYTYLKTPAITKSGTAAKTGAASKTGTATKTGAATKTGTVALTGNSAADTVIGGRVVIDGEGYADDGQYAAAGAFTGSSGALIQTSRHAIKHFLVVHMGLPIGDYLESSNIADMSTTYQINGCIVEPGLARAIAARMAFESGCWLKFSAGRAKLIFRTSTYSAVFTLPTNRLAFLQRGEVPKQTADIRPMPSDWLLTKIDLRYSRDWRQGRGPDAYRAIEPQTAGAAALARYNVKERPDLFMCDFITTSAHAAALAAKYLAIYGTRRKLVRVRTKLFFCNAAFGDHLAIDDRMIALTGECVGADFTPGNAVLDRQPEFEYTVLG